jgi:hypothetical protein
VIRNDIDGGTKECILLRHNVDEFLKDVIVLYLSDAVTDLFENGGRFGDTDYSHLMDPNFM